MKTKQITILLLGILACSLVTMLTLGEASLASSKAAAQEIGQRNGENSGQFNIYQPIIIKAPGQAPPAPAPSPGPGENWVVNGDFTGQDGLASYEGWSDDNGFWSAYLHDPLPCSPSDTWYLQMDTDLANNQWPGPGSQDWAWQDITPPGEHSILYLHWEEAHHMIAGIIQLTLYGKTNGGPWEIVYRQTGVQSPPGTGKCEIGSPPEVYNVTIPVAQEYDQYRLEVYGKMLHPDDAVLWGDFRLRGTN
jgi:hypothetical protein